MPFTKLKFALCVVTVLLASTATANSGGGEAAPKEGEGAAAPLPKDQKEFIEKSGKLTSLTNKIADSEKTFQELVHKKEAAKTIEAKQAVIKEMVELTNQRNKDVDSYNRVKSDLSYRYPAQGAQLNRHYQTQNKRSVEELEGVAGLDELLTRTKKVVERKFAPLMPDDSATPVVRKGRSTAPIAEEPARLRLEK